MATEIVLLVEIQATVQAVCPIAVYWEPFQESEQITYKVLGLLPDTTTQRVQQLEQQQGLSAQITYM